MSTDPTKTLADEMADRSARLVAAQQEANDIAAANRAWFAQLEAATRALKETAK
jgi:hypothetical protein